MQRSREIRIPGRGIPGVLAGLLLGGAAVLGFGRFEHRSTQTPALYFAAEEDAAAEALLTSSGDDWESYHRARTAAEYAARAGDLRGEAAFRDLAEEIRDEGAANAPVSRVVADFRAGRLPEVPPPAPREEEISTPEAALPSGSFARAQAAARAFAGENIRLAAFPAGGDRILFAGRSVYVIADLKSGQIREAVLSLPPGEGERSIGDCVRAAEAFLTASDPSSAPVLLRVRAEEPGFAEVFFETGEGRRVRIRVKRDTARVVRVIEVGGGGDPPG